MELECLGGSRAGSAQAGRFTDVGSQFSLPPRPTGRAQDLSLAHFLSLRSPGSQGLFHKVFVEVCLGVWLPSGGSWRFFSHSLL